MINENCEKIMVSIICAAYNHEAFIADALDGFVKQKTNFVFEVIVNDDASTDRTAEIIRDYQQKYPDIIKPIFQTNNQYSQGNSVFQIMLEKSRGKYIATCEGDDYWLDYDKLQQQVDYMEQHPSCSMCGHANNIVTQDKELIRTRCDCKRGKVDLIREGGYMHFATRMARRNVYERFPEQLKKKYYGGVAYIYFAHTLGYLYYDDTPMSVWRINPNSVTHSSYLGFDRARDIMVDYLNFYKSFDEYTGRLYHDALLTRSAEQLVELVGKYGSHMSKNDYKCILREQSFSHIAPKKRMYIYYNYCKSIFRMAAHRQE